MPSKPNRPRFIRAAPAVACLLAGLACLSWPDSAKAQATEYQVKAAFLLNFTKFIEWPPSAFSDSSAVFTICILGKDPFGRTLDDIVEGEAYSGRKIVVRRLSQSPAPQVCQIAFIGASGKEAQRLVSGLDRGPLIVGDGPGFLRDGGMIAFEIDNRRVRFNINAAAAENAGLKLSARLLTVARSVEK